MPQETLVRMVGIVKDTAGPCANIYSGMRDRSMVLVVLITAVEGGNKKPTLSQILPQNSTSEKCQAWDSSTKTCKVKYKMMPVRIRDRELKEERNGDPSKSKWVLLREQRRFAFQSNNTAVACTENHTRSSQSKF